MGSALVTCKRGFWCKSPAASWGMEQWGQEARHTRRQPTGGGSGTRRRGGGGLAAGCAGDPALVGVVVGIAVIDAVGAVVASLLRSISTGSAYQVVRGRRLLDRGFVWRDRRLDRAGLQVVG